jgi:hypothetical protein
MLDTAKENNEARPRTKEERQANAETQRRLSMTDTKEQPSAAAGPSALSDGLAAVHCPNCPDQGWYAIETGGCDMDGENDTRQMEQVQCEFCWTTPNSVFTIEAANDLMSRPAKDA